MKQKGDIANFLKCTSKGSVDVMRPRVRSPAGRDKDAVLPPVVASGPRESHHLPFRGPISGAAVIGAADRVIGRLLKDIEVTDYAVRC